MKFKKYINLFFIVVFSFSGVEAARRIALVDINFAGVERFARIPHLSEKIAEEIVKYRAEKGYFEKLNDLLNVPGIDKKLYDKIKPYLTLTPPREIKAERLYEEFHELQEAETVGTVDVDIEILDKYRVTPLDLNQATFSQLIELPHITEDIADKIIKHRRIHKGFTSVHELRKITTDFIVDKIEPFITVLVEEEVEKFRGNMRFRYGLWPYPVSKDYFEADPIYHNPQYFYSRLRMYYGNKAELGLVLRKDRMSRALNYENIRNYFLIKQYLLLRNILALDTVVIGNYELDFAQGLFIQPSPFLVRRIPRKPRGLRVDGGTHYNANFYGIAGAKRFGDWEIFGFYSNKPLIVDYMNYDGTVGTPAIDFYKYGITYLDVKHSEHYEFFGALKERLYGTRVKYNLTATLFVGGGFYEQKFTPYIDPAKLSRGKPLYLLSDYYFRGDKIRLFGFDAEYLYRNIRLFFDFGRSYYHTFNRTIREYDEYFAKQKPWRWDYGDAYQVLAVLGYEKLRFWLQYHYLEEDYFAFHSSPWMIELGDEMYLRNIEGYIIGSEYKAKNIKSQLSFKYGKPIVSPRYGVEGQSTWSAKDKYEIYFDNTFKPLKKFTVKYRKTYKIRSRREVSPLKDVLEGNDFDVFIPYRTIKNRYELIHEPTGNVRLKLRLETVDNAYKELGANMFGYMTFAELRYKPTPALTIFSRVTYWDANDGASVGAMEFTWPNALIPFGYYRESEKAFRWYIMPTMKFSKKAKLWLKYEFWPKLGEAAKNVFKLQYDFSW